MAKQKQHSPGGRAAFVLGGGLAMSSSNLSNGRFDLQNRFLISRNSHSALSNECFDLLKLNTDLRDNYFVLRNRQLFFSLVHICKVMNEP